MSRPLARGGSARILVLPVLAAGLLALALPAPAPAAPNRAAAKKEKKQGPLLTFQSEAKGERTVEVTDLRFAFFETLYRHKAAPRSESPTGERIEVVQKRKECDCLRLADYSKIKRNVLRQIDITYPNDSHVALVRVIRRDGSIREYPATALYGGDGLFPPRFAATVDGEHREFPLVLPDTPGAVWPEERLVRMLIFRSTAPPPKKKSGSEGR